jgi:hypothetical protein
MAMRVRCCVSKGRLEPEGSASGGGCLGSDGIGEAEELATMRSMKPSQLRKELAELGVGEAEIEQAEDAEDSKGQLVALLVASRASAKSSGLEELRAALKKRARAAGVDEQELEDAEDGPDSLQAIITLIVERSGAEKEAGPRDGEAGLRLRQELQALKPSQLKKRARLVGLDSELLDEAEDEEDPLACIIDLIVTSSSANSGGGGVQAATAPAPDDQWRAQPPEAGVVDHLRNGNASQRNQAYVELEAAVKRRDVPFLCTCVPPMFEVMCMDATKVDTAEQQRLGLLLCAMVSVDALAVGACCLKDDLWMSPYSASGSALGELLAKPVAELTEADALTLACQYAFQSPVASKGWTAVLAAADVDEAHFFVDLFLMTLPTGHANGGTDERNSKFSVHILEMLRQKKLSDPLAIAGAWWLLYTSNTGRPEVSKRQLDLGIHDLALAELRTGSPTDQVSLSRDPVGRFSTVWITVQQASAPSSLLPVADATVMALESGLLQASLSAMRAAEVHGDGADLSVITVLGGGACLLMSQDCSNPEAQRLVREAASSLRFILELEQPLEMLASLALTTSSLVPCGCAMFFGRDESGGPFTFSQADLDAVLAYATEYLRCESFGALFPLNASWSSVPVLNLAISDITKDQLLRNPAWIPHLVDGLLLHDEHPRNQADQLTGATPDAVKAEVQRNYAEALSQVAVYAPGRDALLKDPSIVKSLEQLVDQTMTDEARDFARATLVALGITKAAAAPQQRLGADGDKPPPPHIMASYNWDHQDTIMRVVAWLQTHGYLVWVDTEQMKGSTVDTMALAVEGSELMLIGMSRAYKESSNCRMEAQYGLQKKKPFIPLKLTKGYEADGWLGLMLGTAMYYAFYDEALSSASVFDSRMESLCREIGPRGRVDAVAQLEPELASDTLDGPSSALRAELSALKLSVLKKRAAVSDVSQVDLEEADDAVDIKGAVIELIVAAESFGASSAQDGLRQELQALKLSTLRKRAVGISVSARALEEADDADDIKGAVIELIVALHEDAPSLSSLDDGEAGVIDHLRNGTARQRNQAYTELEAAIKRRDVPLLCACAPPMFEVMCMDAAEVDSAEYQRVGLLLCAMVSVDALAVGACCLKDDVWVTPYSASGSALGVMLAKPVAALTEADALTLACQYAWVPPVDSKGYAAVLAAAGVDEAHFMMECFVKHLPSYLVKGTTARNLKLSTHVLEMLQKKKLSDPLAITGAWWLLYTCNTGQPEVGKHQLDLGIHDLALVELRTGSPTDWVSLTRDPSGRFGVVLYATNQASVPSPVMPVADVTAMALESGFLKASLSVLKAAEVLGDVREMSVTAVLAGGIWVLNSSDCFNTEAQRLVRESASALRFMLELEQPVTYFAEIGGSSDIFVPPICAMFFGRDESGGPFTFTQAHLDAALDFTTETLRVVSWGGVFPLKALWSSIPDLNLSISDANKDQLLRNPAWIPHLVDGLLLHDEHPRNQADQMTGATPDAVKAEVQCGYAEALSQHAVYAPGREALLKDPSFVKSLEQLVDQAMTDEAKDFARATLVALGITKAPASASQAAGDDNPPPHIMASYNWDHQDVILRVVASLQTRGYLVWVDTEQMKGSTVDTMALAVEGSELMLIGMSRAYKESSNCRMEAQYGLQKKKPFIPLKLTKGYEADGWLGLMLGTAMYYAFYDEALSSASVFDSRMESLCREIGPRGRADAVTVRAPEPQPEPSPSVVGPDESAGVAELRTELQALRLTALHKRASAEGISSTAVEAAMDGDKPKSALVTLLIEHLSSATNANSARQQKLRDELEQLKLTELSKRAMRESVDEATFEDAMDSDDPKGSLVVLLLSLAEVVSGSKPDKPHFGESKLQSLFATTTTKHVMLSYNWDHQEPVTRVHDMLTTLGIKCWMDISGGMGADIFDSMAEGVSNASVVVCFMSQKYQDSENCKLELKFARQSGVDIVPVMMQGGGWRASGWLGLLTAGALWTRLTDESAFDENVWQLHGQIEKVIGATAHVEEVASDEAVASPSEAKEELDRLRDTLQQPDAKTSVATVLADPSQPATIPAGVPKLPAMFQSTEQIAELTRLVLSSRAADMKMSRVGFFGMGGIGKTVTGAAVARDEGVRRHFDAIIWLPLGQIPVISKLQNLCHMQCTGKELSAELSSDEKQQALQQAMSGKRVLLCLDDLWEAEHELELNFVDESVGSKVLISTRMNGLLDGGHQLEVGLPSPADSARMLLSAASVDKHSREPKGVREVVDLCGRLPLAMGIAGRLAANLGLTQTQDWSGMIGVLKEELRDAESSEQGMIRASLRGLKGSAVEQSNVRSLLLLFALVPEDTHCPLEALLLIFEAVHPESGVTMMHLRKWLRMLINRSLVLGTIDRPQLHDLVLDWTQAQHSADDIQQQHRLVVDAFRKSRPQDALGRPGFSTLRSGDPVSVYVCNEIGHHVSSSKQSEAQLTVWLGDCPLDEIVVATARAMGLAQLSSLASEAESADDWWLAARLHGASAVCEARLAGDGAAAAVKCMDAIAKAPDTDYGIKVEDLRFTCASIILKAFQIKIIMDRFAEFEAILESDAASREPSKRAGARILLTMTHQLLPSWTGDLTKTSASFLKVSAEARTAAKNHPDPQQRAMCALLTVHAQYLDMMLLDPAFDWEEVHGDDGHYLMEVLRSYHYDTHHAKMQEAINGDWLWGFGSWSSMLLRYGDFENAESLAQLGFSNIRRSMQEDDQVVEHAVIMLSPCTLSSIFNNTGLLAGREDMIALMNEIGLTWRDADATLDTCLTPWIRKRGERTMDAGHWGSIEWLAWYTKLNYVLLARNPGATGEEVLSSLPGVEELIDISMTFTEISQQHGLQGHQMNVLYSAAAVCERFEAYARGLEYADATLSPDLKRAGTVLPIARVNAQSLRGRILASLGRTAEAGAALEAAAAEAHQYGIRLYEAYALRDLKLCVLDEMGAAEGEHGSRRLGVVLRLLKGPAERLTEVLKGVDAAELMALPPPDAGYSVVYKDNATGKAALREELGELRLMALHARAIALGVDAAALEEAMDSPKPKPAMLELIMAQ